jgi:hypothetical protein
MLNVERKSSTGEVISLDDKNFINCVFTNCTLCYSGADFALANTRLENCNVTLSGAAQRTASLLGVLGILKAGPGGLNPQPPIQ